MAEEAETGAACWDSERRLSVLVAFYTTVDGGGAGGVGGSIVDGFGHSGCGGGGDWKRNDRRFVHPVLHQLRISFLYSMELLKSTADFGNQADFLFSISRKAIPPSHWN